MESWREMLTAAMQEHGETWDNVEDHTLTSRQLDQRFNTDYGETEGTAFTLWTYTRVYFPACYDGAEWVASVARHPDGMPTRHIGRG
jgi:hypothetical protein